jgi:hypothetical protein
MRDCYACPYFFMHILYLVHHLAQCSSLTSMVLALCDILGEYLLEKMVAQCSPTWLMLVCSERKVLLAD